MALVRKLNEESIELVHGFRNFKRNLLILIINCIKPSKRCRIHVVSEAADLSDYRKIE